MEDHIAIRPDRNLLYGRLVNILLNGLYLWDVVFHENKSHCLVLIRGIDVGLI